MCDSTMWLTVNNPMSTPLSLGAKAKKPLAPFNPFMNKLLGGVGGRASVWMSFSKMAYRWEHLGTPPFTLQNPRLCPSSKNHLIISYVFENTWPFFHPPVLIYICLACVGIGISRMLSTPLVNVFGFFNVRFSVHSTLFVFLWCC